MEDALTTYISTRGEAPKLGFCDVMLTGLAREPELGAVFAALAEGQKKHLRLLLEILGTM